MNWPRLKTRPATRRHRSWQPSVAEVEVRQMSSSAPSTPWAPMAISSGRLPAGSRMGAPGDTETGTQLRFDRLPRPARQRRYSGRSKGLLGQESMPRDRTNGG